MTAHRVPRVIRRIGQAGAIALVVTAVTGPPARAEEPAEALRLTRLARSEPAAAFSVATQAETGDSRRDSLDADQFRYGIRSREIAL